MQKEILAKQNSFASQTAINEKKESVKDFRFENISCIIVKVTHRCNLDCTYCFENITKGQDMSIQVYKDLVDNVVQNSINKEISFIFHGGEPTLLPITWYIEAVAYSNEQAEKYNKNISYSLQTNLIKCSLQMLETFKHLKIRLGVSLDGPSDIPSPYRERTEKAISNFKIAQELGLNVGVLLTINHTNYNYFPRIMKWLENDIKINIVKANVAYAVGHGLFLEDMKPEYIETAYKDILDYMLETKGLKVIEDNMSFELFKYFANEDEIKTLNQTLCRTEKCCAGRKLLGVTTNGSILPCGRFEWNNDIYNLGNQNQKGKDFLNEFIRKVNSFQEEQPANWMNCNNCEAKKICSYGCQGFIVRSNSKFNIECLPTQSRYKFMNRKESQFRELHNNIKNNVYNKLVKSAFLDDYNDRYHDVFFDYGDS